MFVHCSLTETIAEDWPVKPQQADSLHSLVRRLELSHNQLFHPHHRLHGAPGSLPIGTGKQRHRFPRHDLPGQAEAVAQPAAGHRRAAARNQGLSGSLNVAVAIRPDGSLYSVQILKSSGNPIMDEGAIKIVRLSAPFAPLPQDLLRDIDILVITRSWRFDDQAHFSSK